MNPLLYGYITMADACKGGVCWFYLPDITNEYAKLFRQGSANYLYGRAWNFVAFDPK
jgi:hypothetical protein